MQGPLYLSGSLGSPLSGDIQQHPQAWARGHHYNLMSSQLSYWLAVGSHAKGRRLHQTWPFVSCTHWSNVYLGHDHWEVLWDSVQCGEAWAKS